MPDHPTPQKCCICLSLKKRCLFTDFLFYSLYQILFILFNELNNDRFQVVMNYISITCGIITAFLPMCGVYIKRSKFFVLWLIHSSSILLLLTFSIFINSASDFLEINMQTLTYRLFILIILFYGIRVLVSYQLMKEACECNKEHNKHIPNQIIEDHFQPSYSCLVPEQQKQQIQAFNKSCILGTKPQPTV